MPPPGTGVLSFGLVAIPVRIHTATKSENVSFHLLHNKCGSRVRNQYLCPVRNVVAEREDLVRGFQPSQEVPVIVQNDGVNELKPMKWGLVPSWLPDRSIGSHMINARAETITEKPSYRRLVESKRCLIPADGFYEWRREGNSKIPVWFHLKNKQPFAFAGLWDMWAGC